MLLKSKAFQQGQMIPIRHTCEGANLSPELHWKDPPEKTQCFALIVDDPDAPGGTWVHWVLYNIPASTNELAEGQSDKRTLDYGMRQGRNDFRKIGYGGPCPPTGHGRHRYFFKLYALDDRPDLGPEVSKAELKQAIKGHILAEAELMGIFERK